MGLMRPGGIIRPNALARRRRLSFAIDFANPEGEAWVRGGGGVVPGTFQGGGARGTNRAGWALTGANGWWGAGAGVVTYSINPTAGTLLVFTRPDFNSNTTLNAHMLFSMGDYFPTGPGIEWNNYVDGNCYIGKIDGSNKRIVASNAGLWTAGDDVVLAYTWNPDGQIAYVNGRNIGSNALTGSSSTSGQPFYIGYLNGYSWQWNQTADGAIYYVLIFDDALSEGEVARAAVDPWWWVERAPPRVYRLAAAGVSVTLSGAAGTAYAGTLTPGIATSTSGSAATSAAGTPTSGIGTSPTGEATTASAGAATIGIGMSVAGSVLTASAGSLAYTIGFVLTGSASAASGGTLTPTGADVLTSRSLTGIRMTAMPGNVRVTGGTRWSPSQPQAVTPPSMVGNTMQPPPRLTGDAATDMRMQHQWLQTLYDQQVKVLNILGRVLDHENRIASLEASNDNQT